jgi:gliding motility-associated-like protein
MDYELLINNKGKIQFFLSFLFIVSSFFLETKAQSPNEPLYFWQDSFLFKTTIDECTFDTICVWDLNTLEIPRLLEADIAFDTTGQLYFITGDGKLYTIDTLSGNLDSVFGFEFDPSLEYSSGLYIDYKNIVYTITHNGWMYTFDLSSGETTRTGPYFSRILLFDLTMLDGHFVMESYEPGDREYTFVYILPFYPDSTEYSEFKADRGFGGHSALADSCGVYHTTGVRVNPTPYLFYKIYHRDSIVPYCDGILPNPYLGSGGSAYKNEYLSSLPQVHFLPKEYRLWQPYPCDSPQVWKIELEASGNLHPLRYAFDSGSFLDDSVFTIRSPGWHYFYAKDERSCFAADSIYIPDYPPLELDSFHMEPTACLGDSSGRLELFVSGGKGTLDYAYDGYPANDTSTLLQIDSGWVYYRVTDSMGCILMDSVFIGVKPPPDIVSSIDQDTCGQGKGRIRIQPQSGLAYQIAGVVDNTFEGLYAGSYKLETSYGKGCLILDTLVIEEIDLSQEVFRRDSSCQYETRSIDTLIYVNQYGCDSAEIVEGIPIAQEVIITSDVDCGAEQSYSDTTLVQGANDCDTLRITNYRPGRTDSIVLINGVCETRTEQVEYYTNGEGCDSIVIRKYPILPKDTIIYRLSSCEEKADSVVRYQNQWGCDSLEVYQFEVKSTEVEVLPERVEGEIGDSVQLQIFIVNGTIEDYVWEPPISEDDYVIFKEGEYRYIYRGIDSIGCEISKEVIVIGVSRDGEARESYYIPNVFSPNGDGINDIFQLSGNVQRISYYDVSIYDRWGHRMYGEQQLRPGLLGWDGADAAEGVYSYRVRIQFVDGSSIQKWGTVTLVR